MKLVFGVVDVAYSDPESGKVTTTGGVAEVLEKKYHVMRVFYELHEKKINAQVVDTLHGMIETVAQGGPRRKGPIMLDKVETAFRNYLSQDEWQKASGQTIQDAKNGISHRFKDAQNRTVSAQAVAGSSGKGLKKVIVVSRGPRPAFIDTGLYSASFKSWLT